MIMDVESADVFLRVLVLSVSTSVSNSRVVVRPIVVIVSVTMACSVSTINVPGPDTVAVNAIGWVVVRVLVTTITSQTSWYRLHSKDPVKDRADLDINIRRCFACRHRLPRRDIICE
jgi:hypothetical protein